MDVTGWIRKCVHAILISTLMWIMYENLLKWSQGQTNISFIPSSATTLPYPSVTICPYNISDSIEDIDSIRGENRLLRLNHVVDNVLDLFDLRIATDIFIKTFFSRKRAINKTHPFTNEAYVSFHLSYDAWNRKVMKCFTYDSQGNSVSGQEGQVKLSNYAP